MSQRLILTEKQLQITLQRLSQQLIENYQSFADTVIIGLQPRGSLFAKKISEILLSDFQIEVPIGFLDTTFHRDDFRRRDSPKKASFTDISFQIEDKSVVLIDDVIYTGRSIRAALDAMITFGRPRKVELMVLIERKYSRQLPISATYIGKKVNTSEHQMVAVEWKDDEIPYNSVKLVDKHE